MTFNMVLCQVRRSRWQVKVPGHGRKLSSFIEKWKCNWENQLRHRTNVSVNSRPELETVNTVSNRVVELCKSLTTPSALRPNRHCRRQDVSFAESINRSYYARFAYWAV